MWWQRLETSMRVRISRSFRLPPDFLSPNSPHGVFGSRFNSPLRVVFFAPLGASTHTESDSPPWRCRSLGHNDPSDTVRFVVTSPTASRRGRAWRSPGYRSLGYRPVRHASQPASAVLLTRSQRSLGYRPVRCDLPHCLAQREGMAFSRIPSSSPCLAARLGGAAPWSQRSLGYRPVRRDLPHCLAQRGP